MQKTFQGLLNRDKEQRKEGDPWSVIPIKNSKCAKQTTEIYMGKLNIQFLKNFNAFQNLQTLWLNDNKLQFINGLQKNFRLKHLFLQNNQLKTLKGSIQGLSNLQTLCAYNNQLRDLNKVLNIFNNFPRLSQVDLFENPLADESNYRNRLIKHVETLTVLDRHQINTQQRTRVNNFFQNLKKRENK